MKESEAKDKVCPMPKGGFCCGSNCMMWEDHTPDKVVLGKYRQQLRLINEPPADHHYIRSGIYKAVKVDDKWEFHRISDEQYGDCGLKAKESGCFYPG